MHVTVNQSAIGEIFFSRPLEQELEAAQERIESYCRAAIKEQKSEHLEYELAKIKQTKTAFYFLMVKEICSLAKQNGHAVMLKGSVAGALVSYLLGISPFYLKSEQYSGRIWEGEGDFTPIFEISISGNVRPLIQQRLNEAFWQVKDDRAFYCRIGMTDWDLCNGVNMNSISISNFDENVCTRVWGKLCPEHKNVTCNFELLVRLYAYKKGSFSNSVSLQDVLNNNVFVTRDELYTALINGKADKTLALQIIKKGIWGNRNRKNKYIAALKGCNLPQAVEFTLNNAHNLWDKAPCISRLCLICQREYENDKC